MELSLINNRLLIFAVSFSLTYALIPICIVIAKKLNILDYPNGSVKKHKQPTPYLGGVAIFLGFLITLVLIFPFNSQTFYLVGGCLFLLILGLADDIKPLQPWQKMGGQLVATLYFLKGGLYLKTGHASLWHISFSGLWMLMLINAFNLIDIMDGLAASVALWCSCGFFLIALLVHQCTIAGLMLALAGSLVAFLGYNAPPARIYLGDAGALFLGGLFGCVPFLFDWQGGRVHLATIVILAIPLLEFFGLIIIRSYKKIPFYLASPHHFAIYLQKKGKKTWHILMFISVASWITIICALLFVQGIFGLSTLTFLGICYIVSWLYCIF